MRNRFQGATVVFAVLSFFAAALLGCSSKGNSDSTSLQDTATDAKLTPAQREHIQLYRVAASQFRTTIAATGAVDFDADQATSVLAPFSGPVLRLLVALGEQVKQGQPLAVVDSPDFATAISAYRKAISSAQTARRLADLDKDLIEHNGVARREADQAETDAANAEADREAALQTLNSLQVPSQTIKDIQAGKAISRIDGVIRAPLSGTVVEKLITPGELLQAGTTPCFTVADLSRVWVLAQLFGADLDSVKVGDSAQVDTGIDGARLPGVVDNISALVDPDTRSVVARVVVKNPGGVLKKQMYVRVLIQARHERSGMLVPVAAILRDDVNLPFVYAANTDGSFARRHVTLGGRIGEEYDIADGLKAGDQIVIDGGIFVQFMQNQ